MSKLPLLSSKHRLWIIVALAILTAIVVILFSVSQGPIHEGKTTKELFDRISLNAAEGPNDRDVQGLMGVGDKLVPFLVAQLRMPSKIEASFRWVLQKLYIRQGLNESVIDRMMKSVYLLRSMGPKARTAVPDLIRIAKNTQYPLRCEVIGLLGDIRSEPDLVIPFLVQCLKEQDVELCTALALGQFGKQAESTAPLLRKKLENATPGAADFLVPALIGMSNSLDIALPLVEARISSTNVSERYRFVQILSVLSPDAKAAIPFLRKAMNDGDATVRRYATNGLRRIDP